MEVARITRWPRAQAGTRPKVGLIVYYEGEEGHLTEKVELRSADDEPIRKPADEFERYTRKKPPEA